MARIWKGLIAGSVFGLLLLLLSFSTPLVALVMDHHYLLLFYPFFVVAGAPLKWVISLFTDTDIFRSGAAPAVLLTSLWLVIFYGAIGTLIGWMFDLLKAKRQK